MSAGASLREGKAISRRMRCGLHLRTFFHPNRSSLPVTKSSVHVDHFIPWSFIKDDNLWNFVLACPKCNESKNDKLAPKAQLDLLVRRNEKIIVERPNISLMRNYQAKRLIDIYSWASDNGYKDIWIPPQRKAANG